MCRFNRTAQVCCCYHLNYIYSHWLLELGTRLGLRAYISATRKFMKTYVHNFYCGRKHQFGEQFLWMYTHFYIIFKRKTHTKAGNQENTSRQFSSFAFAVQDLTSLLCCLGQGCGKNEGGGAALYRAAIQRFSKDFINSWTQEKESVTVGQSVSF